jgi:uncharacterized protein YprB with RNaseH-like and TPR domain
VVRWITEQRVARFSKRAAFEALKAPFKSVDNLDLVVSTVEKHGLIRPRPTPDPAAPVVSRVRSTRSTLHCSDRIAYSQNSHKCLTDSDSANCANSAKVSRDDHGASEVLADAPIDASDMVGAAAPGQDGMMAQGHPTYVLVAQPAELAMVATAVEQTALVGLDVETTGLDPRADRIRLLSLACDTIDCGTAVYIIDCFAVDPAPLWVLLRDRPVVGHNLLFDLQFLAPLASNRATSATRC